MEERHKRALRGSLSELQKDLEVKDVINELVNLSVLDGSDEDKLKTMSRSAKVPKLVTILQEKRNDAFGTFLRVLKDTEYPSDSLEKLRKRADKKDVEIACTKSIRNRGNEDSHEIRELSHHEEQKKKCKLRKCTISTGTKPAKFQERDKSREKVILVVGKSGDGKTTMLNRMVNHVLGVEWYDNFRYELPPDINESGSTAEYESQTKWITTYALRFMEGFTVPSDVTFVDTPGFLDTEKKVNNSRDEEVTEQMQMLFSPEGHVDHIDAVAFVIKASEARTNKSMLQLLESVCGLFGADLTKNIFVITTHSELDGNVPPSVGLLRAEKFKFEKFFPFNNTDRNSTNLEKSWIMGETTLNDFFRIVIDAEPKSTHMSYNVLKERKMLDEVLGGIRGVLKSVLQEIGSLKNLRSDLNAHGQNVSRNETFTRTNTVIRRDLIDTTSTALICLECKNNCHYPCDHWFVSTCSVFEWYSIFIDTNCHACRCATKRHERGTRYYRDVVEEETETLEDIKKKYLDAKGKYDESSSLISKVEDNMREEVQKLNDRLEKVREIFNRLENIAYSHKSFKAYLETMKNEEYNPDLKGMFDNIITYGKYYYSACSY